MFNGPKTGFDEWVTCKPLHRGCSRREGDKEHRLGVENRKIRVGGVIKWTKTSPHER